MAAMLPLAAKYGTGLVVLALDGRRHLRRPPLPPGYRPPGGPGGPGGGGAPKRYLHRLPGYGRLCQPGTWSWPPRRPSALVRQAGYRTILGVFQRQPRPAGAGTGSTRPSWRSVWRRGSTCPSSTTASRGIMETLAACRVLTGEDRGCAAYSRRPPDRRHRRQAGGAGSGFGGGDAGGLYHQRPEGDGPRRRGGPPGGPRAFWRSSTAASSPPWTGWGSGYERGTLFLPQLMASAEAVKAAFDVLRSRSAPGDWGPRDWGQGHHHPGHRQGGHPRHRKEHREDAPGELRLSHSGPGAGTWGRRRWWRPPSAPARPWWGSPP